MLASIVSRALECNYVFVSNLQNQLEAADGAHHPRKGYRNVERRIYEISEIIYRPPINGEHFNNLRFSEGREIQQGQKVSLKMGMKKAKLMFNNQ